LRQMKPLLDYRRFRRPLSRCRLRLEPLEDRWLPSILTVTSTADSGPGSLRAELAAAANGDEIVFALRNPSTIQLTSGTLNVNTSVSIMGPGPSTLTIKGNNTFGIFSITAAATLSGVTITGGNASGDGGGIRTTADLVISNCVVTGNAAAASGGGISRKFNARLTMFHCTISGNSSVFNGGGLLIQGIATIADSTITGNTALLSGGGVTCFGAALLTHCTVSNNSVISSSTALAPYGGGVEINAGGTVGSALVDCTISGNSVQCAPGMQAFGGGVGVFDSQASLFGCTVVNNSSIGADSDTEAGGEGFGGGIGIAGVDSQVTTSNSTVEGNVASGGRSPVGGGDSFGGGIYGEASERIYNCTIVNNACGSSGGGLELANFGQAVNEVLANTIIANNSAPQDTDFFNNSTVLSANANLIRIGDGSNLTNGTGGNQVGTSAAPINPLLGPLQNNGGPTPTMLPGAGSPALNAGWIGLVASQTDQRGLPRVVGGLVDIGSVQVQRVHLIAVGAGYGGAPEVKVYDPTTGQLKLDFLAYEASFRGGVRVAMADVDLDGIPDIITGPGGVKVTLVNVNGALVPSFDFSAGRAPEVRVFSGADGHLIESFMAYDPSFKAGIFVAAGNIFLANGIPDIVTAPDATGQAGHTNVRVFFGGNTTGVPDRQFNAYDPGFGGGVRIAVGDITGDGIPDVITGPGIWSGPDVRVFDGYTIQHGLTTPVPIGELLAYDPRYFGGVFVAAGDVNGDRRADVITGTNGNGGPEVKAFDGQTIGIGTPPPRVLDDFFAYSPLFGGGSTVAALDVNGDGIADIVTGAGPGGGPHVRIFNGPTGQQLTSVLGSFYAFDPNFSGGVFVGGA
jgi:hypothetical protein